MSILLHAPKPVLTIWFDFRKQAFRKTTPYRESMANTHLSLASVVLPHKAAHRLGPGSVRQSLYGQVNQTDTRQNPLLLLSHTVDGRNKQRTRFERPCASLSTSAPITETQNPATGSEQDWSTFCEKVSGEWEGATATFAADGQPQELPSQYVPKEFNDWDVTLYDWQSQCSMQPTATGIKCLLKRLMPTVGCEADAQSFHEEARHLMEINDTATQHVILANGSYTTVSSLNISDRTKLRVEHCLMTAEEKRIRVVQHVMTHETTDTWQLSTVELHHEYYDGPYNGGASLSGCGGGMSNFAELDKFDASQLQHHRAATSGSSYSLSEEGMLQPRQMPSRCYALTQSLYRPLMKMCECVRSCRFAFRSALSVLLAVIKTAGHDRQAL